MPLKLEGQIMIFKFRNKQINKKQTKNNNKPGQNNCTETFFPLVFILPFLELLFDCWMYLYPTYIKLRTESQILLMRCFLLLIYAFKMYL